MKFCLILNRDADQVEIKTSFDQLLGSEDCFVSCERSKRRTWRLTYHLNQLTQEQIDWLLYHLQRPHLLGGEIEAEQAGGVDFSLASFFAIGFGKYRPFTIKFHR